MRADTTPPSITRCAINAPLRRLALAALCTAASTAATAQSADELAKQLANPVASLISVPFQNN